MKKFALMVVMLGTLVVPAFGERLPFKIPRDPGLLPETALIVTNKGPIEISFYRYKAPVAVTNFVYLIQRKYYHNTRFHLYRPGFIIQGGDPSGTGQGGMKYKLPPEFSEVRHVLGTLAMARRADAANPERLSHGSQFYICLGQARHLDRNYTVFAQVVSGLATLGQLRENDEIVDIRLPKAWKQRKRAK